VEQRLDSDKPVKVPGARGLLVFDSAGHMLEVVTRTNIELPPGGRICVRGRVLAGNGETIAWI
jgi:hypothetical protein